MSDFIASSLVAITQTTLGYPLDTVKVLLQSGKLREWVSKNTFKPWKIYSGVSYPLLADFAFTCSVFPIYHRSLKYTQSSILSGILAGTLITPILFISDTNKILRQHGKNTFSLSNILKLKYGKYASLCRETTSIPIYFSTYEYMKDSMGYSPAISGGSAGLVHWTITYPIDVIRTRQLFKQISVKDAWREGKLYRGYSVCALRAVLVNAAVFTVWDKFT